MIGIIEGEGHKVRFLVEHNSITDAYQYTCHEWVIPYHSLSAPDQHLLGIEDVLSNVHNDSKRIV